MHYTILKTIIETSLMQYSCQSCKEKIDENAIQIDTIENGAVDFTVVCQHCQTEARMHAEIGTAQVNGYSEGKIQEKKENILLKNSNAIQESDIVQVEKNLSEKLSIEDLLK